jgi:hypothetical protein
LSDSGTFAELFGDEALENALSKFQDTAFEMYAKASTTRVRIEDFAAIRALYYDIHVRYGESSRISSLISMSS